MHERRVRSAGSSARSQQSNSYSIGAAEPSPRCEIAISAPRRSTSRLSSSCVLGSSCGQRTATSGGARGYGQPPGESSAAEHTSSWSDCSVSAAGCASRPGGAPGPPSGANPARRARLPSGSWAACVAAQ
eukprot:scaffold69557_cov59-Phaeocystis_antarctica.AAC.1